MTERDFLTERMTDRETMDFDIAVDLYRKDKAEMSDCIIANNISRELWDRVCKYRELVAEGGPGNAKQDS